MGYIKGIERNQQILFPSAVEDYIEDNNPVRAIAAFVEAVDFIELGFERAQAAETGRPGFDPRQMMGLFIWGHLNRARSSRKLEAECKRNLEVIWLMRNLRPDHWVISEFRKNNGEAIKKVVVKFRMWCQQEGLYGGERVSVDGSKFKAVNAKERNYTEKKLQRMIKQENERIEKYLKEMEEADKQESNEAEISAEELREKIGKIKERLSEHERMLSEMKESGERQISLTDEDARLMKTSNGGNEVGYNAQMVVDEKNKLIAEYEVTNEENDTGQLANMAKKAKQALGVDKLTVLADGGYFDGNNIKECEEGDITTYLPRPNWKSQSGEVFGAEQFRYQAERDSYVCPQGEEMTLRGKQKKMHGKEYKIYQTKACAGCPLRAKCTKSKKGRKIMRWEHQEVLDRLKQRMANNPGIMKERKKLSEHPFGTIKRAMDQGYFLLKGIKKVTTEISLTVLAYNLKRVINIFGAEQVITSMNIESMRAMTA
jgi:transposase